MSDLELIKRAIARTEAEVRATNSVENLLVAQTLNRLIHHINELEEKRSEK